MQSGGYKVQLDITPPDEAMKEPGVPDVIERSARLREKIQAASRWPAPGYK